MQLDLKPATLKRQLGISARGAFKCGPPENAEAWRLIADEFFAGVDRVPPCKSLNR